MLLIEEDERIEPDTLWKELIVSATVRAENSLSDMTERFDFDYLLLATLPRLMPQMMVLSVVSFVAWNH